MSGTRASAAIAFRGVAFSFAETGLVLDGLDFAVEPGEFVTLLGPSGCGKSTILRLIAGFERPENGSLTAPNEDRGFVFQEAQLLPWRTALENAALPLQLKARSDARARAGEVLNQLGLAEAHDKYPNQLSGGMKMRVSVARALVTKPQLLLLDEPFAALDDVTRQHLQEDLRALWLARGMTVVFVTHSVSEAVFLSDRVIQLSARPARIRRDFKINLGRERAPSLRFDARYLQLVSELSEGLREAGVSA